MYAFSNEFPMGLSWGPLHSHLQVVGPGNFGLCWKPRAVCMCWIPDMPRAVREFPLHENSVSGAYLNLTLKAWTLTGQEGGRRTAT